MADYERRILNALLDSYENSVLSRGENKVAVHIAFRFTRASMPEYYDESSTEYEEIHACLSSLEEKGFVDVQWRGGVKGHIVQKVILRTDRVDEVYRCLQRTPKEVWIRRQREVLLRLKDECRTPAAAAFIAWLSDRLARDLPVKEYIGLSDPEGTERLIRCVWYVEGNKTPCYIREFSILHFGDSKVFEKIRGPVRSVLIRFGDGVEDADEKAVFAEYGIYDTPNYVYLKGEGFLTITAEVPGAQGSCRDDGRSCESESPGSSAEDVIVGGQADTIFLGGLRQGIGISGEDLETIQVSGTPDTRRVITVENLTTFFRIREENALIIYLGGYHNQTRRRLLAMIYDQLPEAEYLHFGDIDAGGFAIYEDLCRRTGIPFRTWHMGIEELVSYADCAKPLTANDRRRLQQMQGEAPAHAGAYRDVIAYMLAHDIKLEQECIGLKAGGA